MDTIKIGTRGSELALAQSGAVKSMLERAIPEKKIELVIIKTTGDKILDSPLSKIGDKGLFTREIEEQLLSGAIDLAVHSMKDLPTKLPDGLTIGAVTKREDPSDVFISKNGLRIVDLAPGDMVATGSLRRRAQLMMMAPGVEITDIRGNLNTRIAKFQNDPRLKGLILAHAGLIRTGLTGRITEVISRDLMVPAVGQAALALEIRKNDRRAEEIAALMHDDASAHEVECERSFLNMLGGGCQVPVAGSAVLSHGKITLTGMVSSLDGRTVYRDTVTDAAENRDALGRRLAESLLERGAGKILDEIYHRSGTGVENE